MQGTVPTSITKKNKLNLYISLIVTLLAIYVLFEVVTTSQILVDHKAMVEQPVEAEKDPVVPTENKKVVSKKKKRDYKPEKAIVSDPVTNIKLEGIIENFIEEKHTLTPESMTVLQSDQVQ